MGRNVNDVPITEIIGRLEDLRAKDLDEGEQSGRDPGGGYQEGLVSTHFRFPLPRQAGVIGDEVAMPAMREAMSALGTKEGAVMLIHTRKNVALHVAHA